MSYIPESETYKIGCPKGSIGIAFDRKASKLLWKYTKQTMVRVMVESEITTFTL